MNSQQLDRRLELQQLAETQSDTGAITKDWVSVGTVYAKRLGAKGREYYSAGAELGVVEQAFQIRHSSAVQAVDATWRLIYEGRIYNILGVDETGRKEFITLLCKSGADHG